MMAALIVCVSTAIVLRDSTDRAIAYPAKLNGTSGHIIIDSRNEGVSMPTISFVPVSGTKAHFVRPIDDIVEIKKVSRPHFTAQSLSSLDFDLSFRATSLCLVWRLVGLPART